MNKIKVAKQLIKLAQELIKQDNPEIVAKNVTAGWTIYGYDDACGYVRESLNEYREELKALKDEEGNPLYRSVTVKAQKGQANMVTNMTLTANVKKGSSVKPIIINVALITDGANVNVKQSFECDGNSCPNCNTDFEVYVGNDTKENSMKMGSAGYRIAEFFDFNLERFKNWLTIFNN